MNSNNEFLKENLVLTYFRKSHSNLTKFHPHLVNLNLNYFPNGNWFVMFQ